MQKKTEKKLTNVGWYIGWYILYTNIFCFFLQGRRAFSLPFCAFFNCRLEKKTLKNVSFYGVCMYVRPKLTFVSFFSVFFILHLKLWTEVGMPSGIITQELSN